MTGNPLQPGPVNAHLQSWLGGEQKYLMMDFGQNTPAFVEAAQYIDAVLSLNPVTDGTGADISSNSSLHWYHDLRGSRLVTPQRYGNLWVKHIDSGLVYETIIGIFLDLWSCGLEGVTKIRDPFASSYQLQFFLKKIAEY